MSAVLTDDALDVADPDVEGVRFAFTGPTKLDRRQKQFVYGSLLSICEEGREFTTGAAHGVDSLCAQVCYEEADRDAVHRIVVPDAAHNKNLVEWAERWWESPNEVVRMKAPAMEPVSLRYRARNERMVSYCSELVAYVWQPEFYRSGEWMTINIARKAEVPVRMLVLPS